jgi:hypothetical protein
MAMDAKVRRMRLRDGLSISAIAFEPATPCAQGEQTHTTGGSGRPLPLVFLRTFSTWGNCSKPRATTDCQPIVSQRLIEDPLPKARPNHQILTCSRLPSRLQFTWERWYGHGFRSSLE